MTGQSQIQARRRYLESRQRRASQALPAPEIQKKPRRNKMETKTRNLIIAIAALLIAGVLCIAVLAPIYGRTLFSQPEMGSAPLIDTSNPKIYGQPQESGQMSSAGKIIYTQSGKPNQQTVTGQVGKNQTIVCTAYRMTFQGDTLDNGVVFAFDGPFNLDKDPMGLTDGACTLVASGEAAQKKLDSVYVDFCRGDKNADGTWWSYQPWALSIVEVGDYSFPADTSDCFGPDQDNYPSFLTRPAKITNQAAQPETAHERVVTGEGKILSFETGTTVCGVEIKLSNGKAYTGCVSNTPTGGTVKTGVIWPWDTEQKNVQDLSK